MHYDPITSFKKQDKMAAKVIKSVQKGLRLKEIPKNQVLGINIEKDIADYERLEKTKTGFEKDLVKGIHLDQVYRAKHNILVHFTLPGSINQISYRTNFGSLGNMTVQLNDWLAVLNLKFPIPVIYGRAANRVKCGGGTLFFAPLNLDLSELENVFDKLLDHDNIVLSKMDVYVIAELNKFFENIHNSELTRNVMLNTLQVVRTNESTGNEFVDFLNRNKKLVKLFRKIRPYGWTMRVQQLGTGKKYTEGKSDVDITCIFLPFKDKTIVNIVNWEEFSFVYPIRALDLTVSYIEENWDFNIARNSVELGNTLEAKGLDHEMFATYKEALRLTPNDSIAHYNFGVVLHENGLLDEAIAEYRTALRINPDDSAVRCNLGMTLHDKGLLDEAIAEYRAALRINPDDFKVHYNLGNTFERKGMLDEAITEYRAALRLNPPLFQAHFNLGVAFEAKGLLDEAIAEYREALRINPNYFSANYNLGITLEAKGNLEEAIQAFQDFINTAPPSHTQYIDKVRQKIVELKDK